MVFRHFTACVISILILSAPASALADEKFRVCADPLNPPYSTKSGKGFENEIASLLAKKSGQHLEYTWFPQRIGFIRNTLTAELPKDSDRRYKCDVIMGVPAGYERTLTTIPYYHSTYVLLIAQNRGWDDIKSAGQLAELDDARREKLRIAMFDRGPGTAWLKQNDLIDLGIPYQTMSGDSENNTAMRIDKDIRAGKIDMVILWGPMAGYVLSNAPEGSYVEIPMHSSPGIKFDFSIAMGVRFADKTRKAQLDRLIAENRKEIEAILTRYRVPLLPIPKQRPAMDDDDD